MNRILPIDIPLEGLRPDKQTRLQQANAILRTFGGHGVKIDLANGCVSVRWTSHGQTVSRRWMTRGQDFYPIWHHKAPWGGTQSTAISQAVRWVQNKPVLPLSTWEYWASGRVKLGNAATLEAVRAAGWPEQAICVLCGNEAQGLDWWHLDGVSGPCCSGTRGCRQGRASA